MAAKITESAGGDMIAPVCLCDLAPAMDVGLVELIGPELDEAYLRAVEACAVMPAPRGKNACKIVYTPLYGSGYKLVPEILRRRGVNVVTCAQHMRPNGNFPGANPPNPEELRAFGPALALAEAEGADVVLGTDPDADRLGAVIRQGGAFTPLTGNQIGVLLLEHILRKKSEAGRLPAKGFAVKSVVSTGLAQPICDKYGVRLEQVPVGFKYTGEKIGLLEDGGDETFLFGFEESSGFLGGSYTRDKDAVYGAMQFAELALDCKNQGITVLDRLDALYAEFGYYTEKTFGLSLDPAEGAARLKQAMDGLRACPPKQIGGCAVERVTDYMSGVDGLPEVRRARIPARRRHAADPAPLRHGAESEDLCFVPGADKGGRRGPDRGAGRRRKGADRPMSRRAVNWIAGARIVLFLCLLILGIFLPHFPRWKGFLCVSTMRGSAGSAPAAG